MLRNLWIAAGLLLAFTIGVVLVSRTDGTPARSIHALLAEAPSDGLIRLSGVVRSAGTNQLTLTDDTDEIRLSTCPAWYHPLLFGAHERVRVVGHLAPRHLWRAGRPMFVVYNLDSEYGKQITLRLHDGVPVWHRYRELPGRRMQLETARSLASAN